MVELLNSEINCLPVQWCNAFQSLHNYLCRRNRPSYQSSPMSSFLSRFVGDYSLYQQQSEANQNGSLIAALTAFSNMCHCERVNTSLREYFLEIDYLVTVTVKAMWYSSLFFIKLRDRMFIKKKNVSSKLEEIVIQTNCLHARFPLLLCSKWGDSVGIVSEQHSGGQINLQGPVLKCCTAVVSVEASNVKKYLDIRKRTVGIPFHLLPWTDSCWHTQNPRGFFPLLPVKLRKQSALCFFSALSLLFSLNIPV